MTGKSAERKLGAGIAGTGNIAETHVRALFESEYSRYVACYHYRREKAGRFSAVHGGKFYSDLDSFLSDPEVDFVIVSSTSSSHYEIASEAIKAGKPVLIEKPICTDDVQCRKLVSLSEASGIPVGGIFNCRYYPSFQIAHKAVADGRLGKIIMASAVVPWYRSDEYYLQGQRSRKKDGGGVLMIQALHAIDLLLFIVGDIISVSADISLLNHAGIDVEDTAVAAVRFRNGALGTIAASTAAYHGYSQQISVFGSDGNIVVEDHQIPLWDFKTSESGDDDIRNRFSIRKTVPDIDTSGEGYISHRENIDDFVLSLLSGRSFMLNAYESSKAVRIVNAIYRSSASGKSISIDG